MTNKYFVKRIRRLVNWWWFDVTNKILLFKLDKCVFAFMTRFLHNVSTSSTLISDFARKYDNYIFLCEVSYY